MLFYSIIFAMHAFKLEPSQAYALLCALANKKRQLLSKKKRPTSPTSCNRRGRASDLKQSSKNAIAAFHLQPLYSPASALFQSGITLV
jgi:hypothetical protein